MIDHQRASVAGWSAKTLLLMVATLGASLSGALASPLVRQSSFIDSSHEIACKKGRPIDLADHIPGTDPKLNRCFSCQCPNGFIKCAKLAQDCLTGSPALSSSPSPLQKNQTNPARVQPTSKPLAATTLKVANKTSPTTPSPKGRPVKTTTTTSSPKTSVTAKPTRPAEPKGRAKTGQSVLKIGSTTYQLGGVSAGDPQHLSVAAEVLGLTPDKLAEKRRLLAQKLQPQVAVNSSTAQTKTEVGESSQHLFTGPVAFEPLAAQ